MKFRSSQDGYITALRFYKQPNNTGTHVGHLWTAAGQQLAEATFENETASGWQEQTLPDAGPDHGDTTYVVSYYSPQRQLRLQPGLLHAARSAAARCTRAGRGQRRLQLRLELGFPDRDVELDELLGRRRLQRRRRRATRARRASTPSPRPTAPTDVADLDRRRPSTFDEAMDRRDAHGADLHASRTTSTTRSRRTVAYDAATRKATLTPSAPLALGRTYTATVVGGSAGVKDAAGNPLAANHDAGASARPPPARARVFRPTEGPLGDAIADSPVEVGMKFRSTEDGWITGAALLQAAQQHRHARRPPVVEPPARSSAEVTFTNETASRLADGAAARAGPDHARTRRYITSYYAASGRFAFSPGYFGSGVDRAAAERAERLRARAATASTATAPSGFPDSTFGAHQLLGRRDVRAHRSRRTRARRGSPRSSPAAGRQARARRHASSRSPSTSRWTALTVNTGSILLADERRQPRHRARSPTTRRRARRR